jgi:hypothetical protein
LSDFIHPPRRPVDQSEPRVTRPGAFLDRDGVLNVDRGYTFRPEDLVLIPTAAAAVRLLNEAGYYVLVVTNQAGVARGYYTEAAVKKFNAHMQDVLLAEGARIIPTERSRNWRSNAAAGSRNRACLSRPRATGRSTVIAAS